MSIVGEASERTSAETILFDQKPDVAIIEEDVHGAELLRHVRRITRDLPMLRVVILGSSFDRPRLSRMLAAGATGYVLKLEVQADLAAALQSVLSGKVFVSRSVDIIPVPVDGANQLASLTEREKEILKLLADGKTSREIGSTLNISVRTVEAHRARIYNRLEISTVADLIKLAIREGLTFV
jgi:DNA-binding NarL/FixJ family response regulator